MKGEVTAIIASAPEGGYWAVCPEFPDANGQGETIDEARDSLRAAILLQIDDPATTSPKHPLTRQDQFAHD